MEELQIQKKPQLFSVEVLNAKTIILTPKTPVSTIRLDKHHYKTITFTDYSINIGDKVHFKTSSQDTYYKANFIYKEDKNRLRINEFENNVSSSYFLPLLNIKKDYLLMEHNFINCYYQHYNFKHNDGEYLYLVYRYSPISYYAKFIDILQKQDNCIQYLKDVNDNRFDCFVFKIIDNSVIKDIKLILDGKFSHISDKSKSVILNFHNQNKPDSPISQILNKGELRRNELEEYFGCKMPDNIDYAEKPKINEEIWR